MRIMKQITDEDLKELTEMFLALSSDKVRMGAIHEIEKDDPVMADYLYEVLKIATHYRESEHSHA